MKRLLGLSAVALVALTLTGCSKLNQENYDKLKMGMTLAEVEAVIGSNDECSTSLGTKTCMWGSKDGKHIKASFMGDAAITFSSDKL